LKRPDAPLGEHEQWLRGKAMPAGEWAWFDRKRGIGILDRFDPRNTSQAYINWHGKDHRINLELWSNSKKLAPKQSLSFEHTFRVIRGPMK
jgi:hypothetical protein